MPRWEFTHALIRQTLAAGLSLPRRQRLHLKVADAIERVAGSNAEKHASDLAHHLFQAGTAADPIKTMRFLTLAGEHGLATAAFEEAIQQFEQALSLLDEADEDLSLRARILVARGRAWRSLGRTERAVDDLQDAVALYQRLQDLEPMVQACWEFAFLCLWRADNKRSIPVLRRGLAMAGDAVSPARCRLLAMMTMALGCQGDVHEAHEMIAPAVTEAEALDDAHVLGFVLHANTLLSWTSS